jgi:hypothetical protein
LIKEAVAEGYFARIIQCLSTKEIKLQSAAVRCCATMLSSNDHSLADQALLEGILPGFLQTMFSNSTEVIKETLWGLSNLCC